MNEIEKRFKPIDKYLKKYLLEYRKINKNTQDTLQNIFNELDIQYSDLNKTIPQYKKNRLDRRLDDLLDEKEDNYLYYQLNQALKKKKMTYRELLESYILSAYYEERKSLDDYDNVFFYNVLETSYNQGIQDMRKLRPKKKHKEEIFNWSILYTILNIPLFYGTKEAYLYALSLTNADEMYKKCINDIQGARKLSIDSPDMQDLQFKQQNRLISINNGKVSGALENMVESYSSLAYLQSGKDSGAKKCRFIAELDNRTTKMCESLNDQIFYVDKMNVYQRYSDIDKGIVTYHTKGLVLGENLPPIMNHFHWCRSTITYLLDDEVAETVRENIKVSNNYDREQYNRYRRYYGDEITSNVEEFTKMKYNNKDEWNYLKQNYIYAKHRYNAINDNVLDPNISVNDYIRQVHEIRRNLIDYEIKDVGNIKDISLHFYDRKIGNPLENRIPVSIEDIKDTLSNPVIAKPRKNGSILLIGRNAKVSYNPSKMKLIQTIPGGKK